MDENDESTPADAYVTRASIFERLRGPDTRAREMAWATFRARYAPVVAGFARRCGADAQDIDDIVQDVMTGFFEKSGDFAYDPAKGRFRGWLKTATVRAAVRRKGKNLRLQGVPLNEVPEVELAVDPLWNDIWEQELVSRALRQLKKSIGQSLAFRAFEQYVLLDRPAEAVASELGTSVDNVHQAKTRITRRLRELVGHLREKDD
jgi:RNA polymerase sigma factor (sigma-70 family)